MYYNWPITYTGVCDVEKNFKTYFDMLTNKCCNLFKWDGLPETVDERFLMLTLILGGKICFTEFDGKLYALNGSIGGEPNVYYEPTQWIIANPILGSKQVKIRQKDGSESIEGLDGILVGLTDVDLESDRVHRGGLYGLIYQTAGLLADNISSLNISQINGRVMVGYTAADEAIANAAEEVLKDMYEGKPFRVMTEDILSKITITPIAASGQNSTLMTLIEAHQYILAQFYNEIGIAGNWNMKRERVNTAETELMTGSLDINIWNMKKNLQDGIKRVNELFGTSISVDLNMDVLNDIQDNEEPVEEEAVVQEDKVEDLTETENVEDNDSDGDINNEGEGEDE